MKSELSKSFLKLPESKKYPRLFKLKTTALIVFILIAIVGIIDLSFFIYIRNNKEPSTNISFINKVVTQTTLLTEGDQVTKMIQNILQPYPASYFQYAQKLSSGPGSKLNLETLKNDIFAKKSKDLLFLFQLQGETQMLTNSIGLFTGASFPLPKDSDYVTSRDYYTLQSSSGFHSVVFSLQNNNFLNFNGTEVPQDILACKNYVLSQSNQYIEFFGLIRKNLFTADIKFTFGNSYKCFDNIGNAQQLVQKISSICGFDVERSALNVAKYEVYHLTNEKPKN